ncbi:flagellar protein FlaG [Psychromonas sp. PT13]|uniref:flagellar protein FlaG n=1 Tax=Psychromonas sp. PT13 TaxID=3439547 RepID=UPI003EBA89AE
MSDLNISLSLPKLIPGKADVVNTLPVNKELASVDKAEQEVKELPSKEVDAAVEEVNAFMQSMERNLSFRVDEDLGEPIISVMDLETDEVIRQIPSEELLVIRKKMDDVNGTLFDDEV